MEELPVVGGLTNDVLEAFNAEEQEGDLEHVSEVSIFNKAAIKKEKDIGVIQFILILF